MAHNRAGQLADAQRNLLHNAGVVTDHRLDESVGRDTLPPQVVVQGQVARVVLPGRGRPVGSGGKRGSVTTFSAASRRRLIQCCLKIDCEVPQTMVTLTYWQAWPDERGVQRDLKTVWDRIRRVHEGAWAVWRLELQERGAPHLHLITQSEWGPSIREAWLSVTSQREGNDREACRERYGTHQGKPGGFSAGYISKYCCKQSDVTYRGRTWGVLGRANVPWAPEIRIELDGSRAYHSMARIVRNLLVSRQRKRKKPSARVRRLISRSRTVLGASGVDAIIRAAIAGGGRALDNEADLPATHGSVEVL